MQTRQPNEANEVPTRSFILYERVYINVIYFDRITDPFLQRLKGIAKTKDIVNLCLNEASASIRNALSLKV